MAEQIESKKEHLTLILFGKQEIQSFFAENLREKKLKNQT